jgi:hypothetical protein
MMTTEEIQATTGGYLNVVALQKIPNVAGAFAELLARVQSLPFVPPEWSTLVASAMADYGDEATWQPRYAIRADAWRNNETAPLNDNVPDWLANDADAAVAWNKLTDWWTAKLQPILGGWARSEAEVLEAANADAQFWNGLYDVVKPVAVVGEVLLEAPAAIAGAASKVVTGTVWKLMPIILIAAVVGVGLLVYKNKMLAGVPKP